MGSLSFPRFSLSLPNSISMFRLRTLLVCLIVTYQSYGQVVTSDPVFPLDTEEVTITFDAAQGTGGLAGYTGDVYAHTGVITENSGSPSDWKYVKTSWGENTPETKLTRVSGDIYELSITPSIRAYYGVPANEKILKLAFVFRSGDSSKEGKGEGGSDIFVDLNVGFVLQVNSPTKRYSFYNQGESVNLSFDTPEEATFTYYVDGVQTDQSTGLSYSQTHVVLDDQNVHELVVAAISTSEGDSLGFRHPYIVDPATVPATRPSGLKDGINYSANTTEVTLVLTAPNKQNVLVIGDFNDWSLDTNYQMAADGDKFWVTLTGLEPTKEYIFQYLIDGSLVVC